MAKTHQARHRCWAALCGATLALIFTAIAPAARGDAFDDVRRRGTLIWGADQEGGGPFVYPDSDDPQRVIGFEVELAELLAAEMGVAAQFRQAEWSTLPSMLESGQIDIILNGYEWTPSRSARMRASRPYYIYELQLVGRADDDSLNSWDDLKRRPGGRRASVSVLGGSSSEDYLRQNWSEYADIVGYNGNTDAMAQVRTGLHDATLMDLPIALFYRRLPQGEGLRFVGEPVAPGYHVIFGRTGEQRLIEAINAAIAKALADGRLKAIYDRYEMWNAAQERLPLVTLDQRGVDAPAGLEVVRRSTPIMLKSAGMTVLLSVASMPLAIIIGLLVAVGRMYGPRWLAAILAMYVEVLRGTPVMLQLYVIFFLLPGVLGVSIHASYAAVIGLAVNYSAYEAEIYRAGLQAIPRGQMEAALALGMSRATALRRVIIPQAVRIVVPPVTNDFIALFKDTSVCSVITVTELTKQYNVLANSTGRILELAAMTALLYMAMSFPLSVAARRMERRLAGESEPRP